MIDGTPAPLLYVSATQINAVLPLKLSTTSPTSFVTVTTNGTSLPPFRLMVDLDDPKVFLAPTELWQRSTGTARRIQQRIRRTAGFYVSIWATGAAQCLVWPLGRWPPLPGTPLAA